MKKMMMRSVLGCSILLGSFALAQSTPTQDAYPADNTKINQRDRDKTEPTADQQKENGSDRETARKIRRAIVEDKSLSTYAHNIKIIAENGTVTLKGPVHSESEKHAVENVARTIAGEANVKSEIQVAAGEEAAR